MNKNSLNEVCLKNKENSVNTPSTLPISNAITPLNMTIENKLPVKSAYYIPEINARKSTGSSAGSYNGFFLPCVNCNNLVHLDDIGKINI